MVDAEPAFSRPNDFTSVELLWHAKRIEDRVRFGRPVSEKILDRHRRLLSFAPGNMFARWSAP